MKNYRASLKALAAATLLAAASARAVLLDTAASLTNPLVTTFDSFDGLITAGPQPVSSFGAFTVTMQSTPEAELGASVANLGGNGLWERGKCSPR